MRHIFLSIAVLFCGIALAGESPVILEVPAGKIHGTLLTPDGVQKPDVVLLIAGSGPTDRDGNNPQMKNNSLKFLADDLAAAGIATVRFDKRGIAASAAAGGVEKDLRFGNYIDDVKAWIGLLAGDRHFGRIFVAGHSEGSQIGLEAAAGDKRVSGVICLAGAGRTVDVILKEQLASLPEPLRTECYGAIDLLKAGQPVTEIPAQMAPLFRPSVQPYLISWFKYDPRDAAKRLGLPLLVVQGDKDIQVSVEDARLLYGAADPKTARLEIVQGMNHVFKPCDTMDKQLQVPTYMNPELKNHPALAPLIVEFIGPRN